MKKIPRLYNRKLKKEYKKGFDAGYQKHSTHINGELKELSGTIKNSFGKYVSEQLIKTVESDIPVTMTIEISGKDFLDIVKKASFLDDFFDAE